MEIPKIPVCELPVMKANCKTCPFRIVDGREQDVDLMNKVTQMTLFKAQQICHGSEGRNRKATHRCKGSFDYNKTIYERLGLDHLLK